MQILSVVMDAAECPVAGRPFGGRTFDVNAGTVATASGAGMDVPLQARRGLVAIADSCDSAGEFCRPFLERLEIDLADTTVAGVSLRNLVVTNTIAAAVVDVRQPNGAFRSTLPPRALQLMLAGTFNGVNSFIRVENRSPLLVDLSPASFAISGRIDFLGTDLRERLLPISVAVDLRGPRSTTAGSACADLSPRQRLFGFEDPLGWTSSAATLSLVTTPLTQGCGALGIQGQHYMPINGGRFSPAGLAIGQALTVDLFIPSNQPNPYWLGALQMYLSCPSGNAFNQFIGQVELTGRPQGQFSSLRFPLPAVVRSTLAQPLDDCAFSFALNVNPTGRTWILDNLRFTP